MIKRLVLSFSLAALPWILPAQDSDLVQFSGVVVTADSLQPLPFVTILIRDSYRGTISDFYGFFSFVARVRDTVDFSCIGYKTVSFVIPDSLSESRYSLIQVLERDTVLLKEAVIYPWPSREDFKRHFLSLNLPDDDLQRAKRSLEERQLQAIAENLPPDGSMTYRVAMDQQYSRLYTVGQLPKNNLLNPIAWAQFIQAWKNGDFRRKPDKFDE